MRLAEIIMEELDPESDLKGKGHLPRVEIVAGYPKKEELYWKFRNSFILSVTLANGDTFIYEKFKKLTISDLRKLDLLYRFHQKVKRNLSYSPNTKQSQKLAREGSKRSHEFGKHLKETIGIKCPSMRGVIKGLVIEGKTIDEAIAFIFNKTLMNKS